MNVDPLDISITATRLADGSYRATVAVRRPLNATPPGFLPVDIVVSAASKEGATQARFAAVATFEAIVLRVREVLTS